MTTKIAINGFGRIGRAAARAILENHPNLELTAVNDLADKNTLLHLLKHDSVYGFYNRGIKASFFAEKEPAKLPWKKLGVALVLECTGFFTDKKGAEGHLKAGAKQVIISAPSKDAAVPTYLLGVNEEKYNPARDKIISMGSCTTNCLAPLVKVLDEKWGIEYGFMNTVHGYTADQNLVDGPHKDLRRARAAAVNIAPTTTGAAKTVEKCLPALRGRLDGLALRVPIAVVSIVDFTAQLKKPASREQINSAFKQAAKKELKGILSVEEAPLVSTDYIGSSYSAIVDAEFTSAGAKLVKVLAWYDNEYGYACRLAEMAEFIAKL